MKWERKIYFILGFLLIFIIFYLNLAKNTEHIVLDSVNFIERSMNQIVSGDYKEKEIKNFDLRYVILTENQKTDIVLATKSLVEHKYYELGNTLYKIEISFTKTSLILHAIPIYDFDIIEKFEISGLEESSNEKFVEHITSYVEKNYKYSSDGFSNQTLAHFLEKKQGKCDDFAKLFYLLAKDRGLDVRIEVNDFHAWNIVKIGGKWQEVDLTLHLSIGGVDNK